MEKEKVEIQKMLDKLNSKLTGVMPHKLYLASIGEIDYLEKNARYMTKEKFAALTHNISKDSALSSVPLVYRKPEDGRLLVLSGNHRIKAAAQAGVTEFLVLLIDRELTRDEIIKIQLSHNQISGQDDEQVLRELFQELQDVEAILYTGFTSEEIQKLKSADFTAIKEEPLYYEEISLLFLPEDVPRLRELFKTIAEGASAHLIFAGRVSEYESILQGLIAAKQGQNIINSTLAFFAMASVVNEYLTGKVDNLQEAMEEGTDETLTFTLGATRKRISKKTAQVLRKTIKEMADKGMDLDASLLSMAENK